MWEVQQVIVEGLVLRDGFRPITSLEVVQSRVAKHYSEC